ncbi:hypothetical protein HPP92_005266 [Vanilla planifolia]|uniref:Secreted protein n=1 Tax=Vanilla planifolia TaxID=51239 RepID=A0A835VD12_VANPL|nr:hypothetical protein HPP92_005551 [Vanilla planifolia]KAG0494272.1 hypothetical protein HPP92_005266 [Vanilla planifolia]
MATLLGLTAVHASSLSVAMACGKGYFGIRETSDGEFRIVLGESLWRMETFLFRRIREKIWCMVVGIGDFTPLPSLSGELSSLWFRVGVSSRSITEFTTFGSACI